jgi:hypothetical protein
VRRWENAHSLNNPAANLHYVRSAGGDIEGYRDAVIFVLTKDGHYPLRDEPQKEKIETYLLPSDPGGGMWITYSRDGVDYHFRITPYGILTPKEEGREEAQFLGHVRLPDAEIAGDGVDPSDSEDPALPIYLRTQYERARFFEERYDLFVPSPFRVAAVAA